MSIGKVACVLAVIVTTGAPGYCQSMPATAAAPVGESAVPYRNMAAFPQDGWSKMPPEWFRSGQARRFADNVLAWQTQSGGWPKVTQMHTRARSSSGGRNATFDNNATIPQMRFIGNMADATGEAKYKQAFLKGLDYLLAAQMPCGGWPQNYPPRRGYAGLITYNDGAMIHVMWLLRDTAEGQYGFVAPEYVAKARAAVDRGLECILKTQITVNGQLTAWCQQHDPSTFAPAGARSFELPSISGAESVGIVMYLMTLKDPSPQVRRAVDGAAAWFKASAVGGIRVVRSGGDTVVVADPSAPPIWARFYDIATNQPIFVDRDGVPRLALAEIGIERRNGYAWYGYWPVDVLKRYEQWSAQFGGKTK